MTGLIPWFSSILNASSYFLKCPFPPPLSPSVSLKVTFSSHFASVLPTLPLKCLRPPGPPPSPPDYFSLTLLKKPWCLCLICPGWISDFSLLFLSLFLFFSFFVYLPAVYEVSEVSPDSEGWRWEGWGIFMVCNNKMCACFLSRNIKCYRNPSFHIFRWLLHIIHGSQLLFQPFWAAQLPSRFRIGVKSQGFPTLSACSTLTVKECVLATLCHRFISVCVYK